MLKINKFLEYIKWEPADKLLMFDNGQYKTLDIVAHTILEQSLFNINITNLKFRIAHINGEEEDDIETEIRCFNAKFISCWDLIYHVDSIFDTYLNKDYEVVDIGFRNKMLYVDIKNK